MKSNKLILARVLVEINKSLAELRIVREKIIRRIVLDSDQGSVLENMLRRTDRFILDLERLSERIQTILTLDTTLSRVAEIADLRKYMRDLEKELRVFNSASALGLKRALEELDKLRFEAS